MSRRSSAYVLGGIGSPSGVRKPSRRPAALFSLGLKPLMPSRTNAAFIRLTIRLRSRMRLSRSRLGLAVERISAARTALPDPAICAQAFRQTQERLVVMTRGAFEDATASTIAAARRVPVLVIEPPTGAKLAL